MTGVKVVAIAALVSIAVGLAVVGVNIYRLGQERAADDAAGHPPAPATVEVP